MNRIFTNFPSCSMSEWAKIEFHPTICVFFLKNHLQRIRNIVACCELHPITAKMRKKRRKREDRQINRAKCIGKSFLKQHIYFNVHFLFLLSKFVRRHNTICIAGRYLCRFGLIFLCHFILLLTNKTKHKNLKEQLELWAKRAFWLLCRPVCRCRWYVFG